VPTARLDTELCFALYSASNRLTSIYRPLLAPYGLTYTQFIVLMALWEQDGISITRLAQKTGLTNATMTPLLKRLEKKGYIRREKIENNERQKSVVLTKAGHDLSSKSGEITSQVFCATGLTKTQAAEMIENSKRIIKQ